MFLLHLCGALSPFWLRFYLGSVFLAIGSVASAAPALQKVRVQDPVIAERLGKDGARLIADYGSYRLFEVDEQKASELRDKSGVEFRNHENVIELVARPLDTSRVETKQQPGVIGTFSGKRLHLVQYAGPMKPEWHQQLKGMGAEVVSYVPHNTYLIYAPTTALHALQRHTKSVSPVQWNGTYLPEYKFHPSAATIDQAGAVPAIEKLFAVQLVNDPAANAATLRLIDEIRREPIKQQRSVLKYVNVIVSLSVDRLKELAAQPDVVSIHPYVVPSKRDERQAQIIAGAVASGLPRGPGYLDWLTSKGFTQQQFAASGFAVDVTDSGLDNGTVTPSHLGLFTAGNTGLASRVIYSRLAGTANAGSTLIGCDGHGTLNTHIIAGFNSFDGFPHTDAEGFHYGLGVAPFVKVGSSVIFDPESYTYPNFGDLQSRAYQDGARISANSWGAGVSGAYNVDSQAYDALVRDAQPAGSTYAKPGNQQMVMVFAAGNSGPAFGSIGAPGTAKNVIAAGASENVHSHSLVNGGGNPNGNDGCSTSDTGADNAEDLAAFSSRGPCADGRKKPDLVAPGTHVSGGVAQNPAPGIYGSAVSCFAATGVCGLPNSGPSGNPDNFFPDGQEFYTTSSGTSHSTPAIAGGAALLRQYFINRSWNPPSPAMTKAWLMNSARHLVGSGVNDTLPSNNQGMGGLDLGFAFDGTPRIRRDELDEDKFTASGQTRTFLGRIADTNKARRVTLAWTDAPGSTIGSAFNNDLDLTVQINGQTYRGNVFLGANSVLGGSADPRNNVESVFLPAEVGGEFVIVVTAANINSDGVPNNADPLDQDFALVAYNGTELTGPLILGKGLALVAENCSPANAAIDPNERVTVSFALQNIGVADATNAWVSLLETTNVLSPSGPQSYQLVKNQTTPVSKTFSFTASGSCNGRVTAWLKVEEAGQLLTVVPFEFTLGNREANGLSFPNSARIAIPDTGTAAPFPSTSSVSGVEGLITSMTVTLSNINHTYTDDLDVLLVGPDGKTAMLMSDAGGDSRFNNGTLIFDDAAERPLPDFTPLLPGSYQPGNFGTADSLPEPAPAEPYGATLGVFNGISPNGTWELFIFDDAGGDVGSIASGWSLQFNTTTENCCVLPAADLQLMVESSQEVVPVGDEYTLSILVSNAGPESASAVVVTNVLPEHATFRSAVPTEGSILEANGTIRWHLPSLSSGAFATLAIKAAQAQEGTFTNHARATSDQTDPVPSDNSVANRIAAILSSAVANLSLSTTNSPIAGLQGKELTYTLVLSNRGPNLATGTILSNPVPEGVTIVRAVPTQGSCTNSDGILLCNFGVMANTSSAAVTITIVSTSSGIITNFGSVHSATVDSNLGDNRLEQIINIAPAVDLAVSAAILPKPVTLRDTATISLFVTNHGPSQANDVVLTNLFPAGLAFVSATTSQGEFSSDANGVVFRFGSVASGSGASATLIVQPQIVGTLSNQFFLRAAEPDLQMTNNAGSIVIPVLSIPAISLTDASPLENAGAEAIAVFTVRLSAPSSLPVTVDFVTSNGTATAEADFVFTSGALLFPPGVREQTVSVILRDDSLHEATETFFLELNNAVNAALAETRGIGKILDTDPPPTLDISSLTLLEGNSGTTEALFNVRLDPVSGQIVTVNFTTVEGTARSGEDFVSTNGTLVFQPGITNLTIAVAVVTDTLGESNEVFYVDLSSATQALLPVNRSSATIENDDNSPNVVFDGFTLFAEDCSPGNGVVDPLEQVTINLALKNVGTLPTAGLSVVLRDINGISAPSAPQDYGVLAPGETAVVRPFTFTARGTCGEKLNALMDVQSGGSNLTQLRFVVPLGLTNLVTFTAANSTAINIPDSGPGTVYPSPIVVSDRSSSVSKVTATLRNFSHTYPGDLDILLVGPNGRSVLLIGAAGGGGDLNGVTLTFDDTADTPLSQSGQIFSGTYKPSRFDSNNLAAPAPAGPYSGGLSVFNGVDPNGTWSLYVFDEFAGDVGQIADGWELSIVTADPACCQGGIADLAINGSKGAKPILVGSNFTFALTITNQGPATATRAVATELLPAGLKFITANTTQGSWANSDQQVSFDLGTMANGSYAEITVTALPTIVGAFTNTLTVRAEENDPSPQNNTLSFVVLGLNSSADDDGDGAPNLQEILAGTNPLDLGSVFRIGRIQINESDVGISFSALPGRVYRLEANDTFPAGSWNSILDNLQGTDEPLQATDFGGALYPQRIYRIKLLP